MTSPIEPQHTTDTTGTPSSNGSTSITPKGWRSVILALVAFLGLPLLPTALRSIVPIGETMVLLMSLLAVCALVGWWRGGSAVFALIWLALAVWMLNSPLGPADSATASGAFANGVAGGGYAPLARGWILLLAAAFGIVSILTPTQGFFVRALSSIGIAMTGAFMLAVAKPQGINNVRQVMVTEFERRTATTIAWFQKQTSTPEWREVTKRHPSFAAMAAQNSAELAKYPERSATVLPALLALQSLLALALAWALYHRLTAVPIGPSFGALRDFRFNDQLIWGLAVGATIFFLPPFAEGKNTGLNLLLFFGAIYLFRGMGVLAWAARGRAVGIGLIILTAILPLVAAVLALGVGVGDTWMDWRKRMQSLA